MKEIQPNQTIGARYILVRTDQRSVLHPAANPESDPLETGENSLQEPSTLYHTSTLPSHRDYKDSLSLKAFSLLLTISLVFRNRIE